MITKSVNETSIQNLRNSKSVNKLFVFLQAEYTEYHRYLQEVVQALESDPDFRERLEKADEDDVRVSLYNKLYFGFDKLLNLKYK